MVSTCPGETLLCTHRKWKETLLRGQPAQGGILEYHLPTFPYLISITVARPTTQVATSSVNSEWQLPSSPSNDGQAKGSAE